MSATESGLRMVVVGQGTTRGRRPHLIRLRQSLLEEVKVVAGGSQLYLVIEIALRRLIDDLNARPPGIEVIQVETLDPTPLDDAMLDQHEALMRKQNAKPKRVKKALD